MVLIMFGLSPNEFSLGCRTTTRRNQSARSLVCRWLRRKPKDRASQRMRVLDLFSGLGGWSAAFKDAGWSVVTVDIEERFKPSVVADVVHLPFAGGFDVVLASPPCEAFSVAAIGHHWTGGFRGYEPATEHARLSLALMQETFDIIGRFAPRWWVVENPRGMMRKFAPSGSYGTTVWYCQFGDERAKPTDLWTNIDVLWPPPCHNDNPACHHARAKRGAKTGTQGRDGAAARAEIPYGLSEFVLEAIAGATRGNPL